MDILLQIVGSLAICILGAVLFFGGCLGNNTPVAIAGMAVLIGGIFLTLTVIEMSIGIEPTIITNIINSVASLSIVSIGYHLMFKRRKSC